MKKLTIFLTFVVLGLFISASIALGATSITSQTSIGSSPFTPSSNVCVSVASTATQYGATSAHLNGNYQYGTCGGSSLASACDPSKIYKKTYSSGGTLCGNLTTAQTNGSHVSGWSE
jgi:hypothetical protein